MINNAGHVNKEIQNKFPCFICIPNITRQRASYSDIINKNTDYDLNKLKVEDLKSVDEFHIGGRKGSEFVADALEIDPGQLVRDIGSGIGGPARYIANTLGVKVEGIDLTPEFVEAASEITEMVGITSQISFQFSSATSIPFDDDTFDAATMIHVLSLIHI